MKLTYAALLNDPDLLERIEKQARRERAEAFHQLIAAPLRALIGAPRQPGIRPRLRTSTCG
jgi:hypothetical protein